MVSLFLLLGCNLRYIVDLFAGLHELASASALRDRSKIRGGGRLVQTWGGPWFFLCKHKREGQTIWCMSLRGVGGGGISFYAKMLGSRSQSIIPL